MVVILMMCLIIPTNLFANDNNDLFAFTIVNSDVDNYAKEKVAVYMTSHYNGNNIEDYKLGKGIVINYQNNQNKFLFPIWLGNYIVATFIVDYDSNEFVAVYSEAYIEQLNYLTNVTTETSPMYIVADFDGVYGVVNNKWYNLNSNIGTYEVKETYYLENMTLVNSYEKLDIDTYIQTRIPASYSKNFSIYYRQLNDYCYSYALGNLLRNMGYQNYTPENIQQYMNYSAGASKTDLANYLSSKGLNCDYSNTGYLSFTDVKNIIYHNNSYIYIGAKSNSRSASHAFVIYGYFDDGYDRLYNFWNPWYSYTQTMNSGTRIIETTTTETFTWNNGYLYNIR